MLTANQANTIIEYLSAVKPERIGVFGSFARNENTQNSDLDILLFLNKNNKVSLLHLIDAEQKLSEALGVKVDLVTERSLNPLIRPYIEKDLKIIFG
jgi:uncharacterized protein